VYDQHNVIFAYGPIDEYVRILQSGGDSEASELRFPAPHRHHYHPEFDEQERALAPLPGWTISPLRDGNAW
jgi:hypothetical protein